MLELEELGAELDAGVDEDEDEELSELDFEPLSPEEPDDESLLPSLLPPSLLLEEPSFEEEELEGEWAL